MLYKTFIAALKIRGRLAEALRYEQLVAERVGGQLSMAEVEELSIEGLVAVLKVAELVEAKRLESGLQRYVAEKQAQGFMVRVGEAYRDQL